MPGCADLAARARRGRCRGRRGSGRRRRACRAPGRRRPAGRGCRGGRRRRRSSPSASTLVGIVASRPEARERGRGREQLHVRGERPRRARRARAQTDLAGSRVDHEQAAGLRRRRAASRRLQLCAGAAAAARPPSAQRAAKSRRGSEEQVVDEHVAGRSRRHLPGIIHVYGQSCGHRVPTAASRDAAKSPSKTALVLGGGGFTGGVYEIGALRALDLLAVNSTVNNFDIYVGTSAGSFVAGDARQRRHPRRNDAGDQRPASPPSSRTSTSARC